MFIFFRKFFKKSDSEKVKMGMSDTKEGKMHSEIDCNNRSRLSNDIITPGGLLFGKRFKRNGLTMIDYMSRGKHDRMTTKEIVECIEGYKIKELIIVPDDAASHNGAERHL